MIPSSSPKKRSLMASGKLRQALRGHGHRLSAIVQIGKAGITPGLVKQLEQALTDHELIKVKVAAESPADRFAAADQLAALPDVNIVQIVGRVVLLYKRHPAAPRYDGDGALVKPVKPPQPADVAAGAKEGGKSKGKNGDKRKDGDKRKGRGKDRAKSRAQDRGHDRAKTPRRSSRRA
jgi:RNA-binding protein